MTKQKDLAKIIAAVFIALLTAANFILSLIGKNPIAAVNGNDLAIAVSGCVAFGTYAWNFWKNRNITTRAKQLQQLSQLIKDGKVLYEEIDVIIKKA